MFRRRLFSISHNDIAKRLYLYGVLANGSMVSWELLSYRERLVETRKVLTTSAKEMKRVKDNTSCDYIYQDSIVTGKQIGRAHV